MQNRFKKAREERCISAVELAEILQVHRSSVANWEFGRRQVPIGKLLQMAEVLRFSVDYLLGRSSICLSQTEPVDKNVLHILHGQPVWAASHGWMLVNNIKSAFVLHNLSLMPFDEVQDKIYLVPPALAFSLRGMGAPLALDAVLEHERVWVEPVTTDIELSNELRGWYHLHKKRLVQNEYGHRFYLDAYGAKWLAFDGCIK